jgi:integrase
MKTAHFPLADPMKILTRPELATVLAELDRKAQRSASTRLNRAVFRLSAWKAERMEQGAQSGEPLVASQRADRVGTPLSRHTLRKRFRTACKVLGESRLRQLTIHHGRHTFISHALAGGRTLAEVRDAAGHANVSVTSGYLHVAVEDEGVGSLFAGGEVE